MRNIGVWLDKDKAHVVRIENNREALFTIPSNMDHFHIHGGSGTRFKGGPQDVVQDSKFLEREKHQHKAYFKELTTMVEEADHLAIFGPAQTFERFAHHIKRYNKPLFAKVKGIQKADSMTTNQVIALVRDFFAAN